MQPAARTVLRRTPEQPGRLAVAVAEVPPASPVAAARALSAAPSALTLAAADTDGERATDLLRALGAADTDGERAADLLRALGAPSFVWIPRERTAVLSDGVDAAGEALSVTGAPARDPEDAWAFAGWGVAARIHGEGDSRFDDLRARAERLWGRLDRAGNLPIVPRLFGGFSFDATSRDALSRDAAAARGGDASSDRCWPDTSSDRRWPDTELSRAWEPFGDAAFVLPKLLHASTRDRAFIAAFGPDPDAASALVAAARRALEMAHCVFESTAPLAAPLPASSPATFADGDEPAWIALVEKALADIDRRAFEKVVLCRTRAVAFAREPDLLRALALLEDRHPACARFLFEHGRAAFLGATPERLIALRGHRAVTEALAGTLPRRPGDDAAAGRARLLASDKDRAEHAFVVEAIRAALAPFAAELSIPDAPLTRTLPHLHHLATPVVATLRERTHVLDLVHRLHPTPALCGTPRAEARSFIRAAEPAPRGWYGGGVGWFDAAGDGSFAVAIRSALTTSRGAFIYAGAGIVPGSDPAVEYIETTAKERTMREALEAAS
ncbi:MAG: isochorismate synthase [Polyangiaceae bacterium]